MSEVPLDCCRANMAHVRQSGLGSGLGFQIKVLDTVSFVASTLGSGDRLFFTLFSLLKTFPIPK